MNGQETGSERGKKTVTNSFFFITKTRHSQDADDVQVILAVLYKTKCWRCDSVAECFFTWVGALGSTQVDKESK